jgi:hypothetical protein
VSARKNRKRFAMRRIDDVARERGHVRDGGELVANDPQSLRVARRQNEIPSARCESSCERKPEPA